MHVATDVFLRGVLHGFVRRVGITNALIGRQFIGDESLRVWRHLVQERMQGALVAVGAYLKANVATALKRGHHHLFPHPVVARADAIARLAADVRFITFNGAG